MFQIILWSFLGLAPVVFVLLFFIDAPYCRHSKPRGGPAISGTAGWLSMEAPSVLVFFLCWLFSSRRGDPAALAFLFLWSLHYVHRAFIFPFRRRAGNKPMPILVVGMGFVFTSTNAYLNGRWLFALGPAHSAEWLSDPRFLFGAALFLAGFAINQHADYILFNLRKPGETGYKIPQGGLYRWISCPNYFGEIIEWSGFALATYSLPALAFAIWTVANLVPRAIAHHRWYKETFSDYPKDRRALIPGLL